MDYAKCRGCKADIIWIVTENGKKCPLDRKPEKRWVMTLKGTWKLVDTYISHFATCEQEQLFRKDKE